MRSAPASPTLTGASPISRPNSSCQVTSRSRSAGPATRAVPRTGGGGTSWPRRYRRHRVRVRPRAARARVGRETPAERCRIRPTPFVGEAKDRHGHEEGPMAQYGILIYSPAPADPMTITPDYLELLERYPAQVAELGGQIITGFALQPSTTATAIRHDVVTDGPFVEAKEVVAGFFVLEAPDLDVALQIAKLNPATRDGGVEVRPLFIPPDE